MDSTRSKEKTEAAFSPSKVASLLVGNSHKMIKDSLVNAGMSEESADYALQAFDIAATLGAVEGVHRGTNRFRGKMVAKQDFDLPVTNAQGEPVYDSEGKQKTKRIKAGDPLDFNNPEVKSYVKENGIKVGAQAGLPGKILGGGVNQIRKGVNKASDLVGITSSPNDITDTQNSSPDSTDDSQSSKTDDKIDQKGKHVEPPVNDNLDKPIIPQKPEAPQFKQALGINTGNLNTPADVAKEMQRVQEMKPGELGAKILNDRVNAELSSPDLTPERKEALETVRNKIQSNNPRDPLTKFDLDRAGLKNAVVTSPVTSEWKDKKTGEPRSRTTHVADFTKTGQNIKNDAMSDLREHGNELTRHNRAVSEVKSAADTPEQAPADNKSPDTQEQRTKSSDAKQKVLDHINGIPDEKAGQMSLSEEIRAKQAIAAPPQHAALTKMQRAIDAGQPISAELTKEAGFAEGHLDTKNGNVDMDGYGKRMKEQLVSTIDNPSGKAPGGSKFNVTPKIGKVAGPAGAALLGAVMWEQIQNGDYLGATKTFFSLPRFRFSLPRFRGSV